MLKRRLIAVLILRDGCVVQSVRFQHTNVIHYDPVHAVDAFNHWAVDEIVFMNVEREAGGREKFAEVLERVSRKCFVPIAAGGWITDEAYGRELLRRGADKMVLNSAFHTDPDLVQRLARRFGRQCIVASIDVKRDAEGQAHTVIDRGRSDTGLAPADAARRAEALGAGEILFNSVDHDGARKGYDLDSLREICAAVAVPVIAFGGVFKWDDMVAGIEAGADAVAAANIFHYTDQSARAAKRRLAAAGVPVRAAGMSAVKGKP